MHETKAYPGEGAFSGIVGMKTLFERYVSGQCYWPARLVGLHSRWMISNRVSAGLVVSNASRVTPYNTHWARL